MILNNNSTQQINTLVIQLQNKITNLSNELKSLNKEIDDLDSKISDLEIKDSSQANDQANDIAEMNAEIKANTEAISGKADKNHTHIKSQITDFDHTHDDRYYTESEIDTKLSGKADKSHTHTKSEITDFDHNHDDRYFTESETNSLLSSRARKWGTVYASGVYSTGYFLLASLTCEGHDRNHDVSFAGSCVIDCANGVPSKVDFYAYIRGTGTSVNSSNFCIRYLMAAFYDKLIATYEVSGNAFTLRLYGRIINEWTRFNTCIDYASTGDVSERRGVDNVSMPCTYSSELSGTTITTTLQT